MDWQPEEHDGDGDPLDRLLAEARWDEPAPEAIHRLRGQWRSLIVWRLRRRRLFALATAGSLLAVGLAFWQLLSGTARPERENSVAAPSAPPAVQPTGRKPEQQVVSVPPKGRSGVGRDSSPAAAREQAANSALNPYEMLLATAHRRAVRERRRQLADSGPGRGAVEPAKPAKIASEPTRLAAAEASDSQTLGRLSREEQDPAVRKEMLLALLARGDRASVEVFLDLAEDARTSADALACAADAPNPPVQALFQCLRSPRAARRMAAARVLGRLDLPAVSCELIALVRRGLYRQEALVALLSSSEATARQFLADAERDPLLSATLWNAKRVFQHPISGTEFIPFRTSDERSEFRST